MPLINQNQQNLCFFMCHSCGYTKIVICYSQQLVTQQSFQYSIKICFEYT